jgi:ABC-2 type transport system permease protein
VTSGDAVPAQFSYRRTFSIARKEVLHLFRDRGTLFFALFIPVLELFMLGYAIDTNVRNVRTVVYDQTRTQESQQLLLAFRNTDDFDFVGEVYSEQELNQAIVAGRARVGIMIPENYSRQLLAGQQAQLLVKVDGSVSSVAAEAVNVANAIALRESLTHVLGDRPLPIDARPQILFNPDTRSANFFIPGLLVVMCQMMATQFAANTIVREKVNGTLEQLFMTPVQAPELILGKLTPYLILTIVEMCGIILLMVVIFRVPINGRFLTLVAISIPFILTTLGLGLGISTKANSTDEAGQLVMGTVMPSIFLSGYVFPVDSMPWFFQWVAQFVPTTWLIDASRGVILRGAGWAELWPHAAVLWGMAAIVLTWSALRFHKKL